MDEVPGNECPICGLPEFTLYFTENADQENGGYCNACGFKGMYVDGRLRQLA